MKHIVQTAIVVLGSLGAAVLVALGAPASAEVQMAVQTTPSAEVVASLLGLED
jgi:hypothetical protein